MICSSKQYIPVCFKSVFHVIAFPLLVFLLLAAYLCLAHSKLLMPSNCHLLLHLLSPFPILPFSAWQLHPSFPLSFIPCYIFLFYPSSSLTVLSITRPLSSGSFLLFCLASMAGYSDPLGSQTSSAQMMDSGLMGAFSGTLAIFSPNRHTTTQF